jgi:hypothetical protein
MDMGSTATAYEMVVTDLWGCRAFDGNKELKSMIQWCAALLAGVPALTFICEAVSALIPSRSLHIRVADIQLPIIEGS